MVGLTMIECPRLANRRQRGSLAPNRRRPTPPRRPRPRPPPPVSDRTRDAHAAHFL